jgi:Mn2+/Fe2+ NRAMP family transporter
MGLIGVGMLGVPVLAGAAAYAVAEASAWRGTLEDKPRLSSKFYAVVGVSMVLGLALNFARINAVKMLFWSAVLNGVLAPPLIVLVVLLTSSRKIMGERTNPPVLKWLGWATAVTMAAAAVAMFATM